MSDNIVLANTTSTTTVRSLRLKLNEVIGVVNQIGRDEHTYLEVTNANAKFATKAYAASNTYVKAILANTNAYIATRASWSALTSTNTSIRSYVDTSVAAVVNSSPGTLNTLRELASALANDANFAVSTTNLIATKISVANTKLYLANTNTYIASKLNTTTFNSALANTNIYIASKASWAALTGTNTALRTLISDRYQVANVNTLVATKATWSALTSTNTSIRNYVDSKAAANTSQLVNGSYNLTLQANSALRLPSGAKLISGFPGFGQYLSNFGTLAGDYVYLSSANGYSYIGVENQVPVIGNGPNMWAFDPDGTIRFPDNTIQATAYAGSSAYLQVTNANATFATKAYAASNAAVRTLISDRLQVANAAATYQTKAVERAALANTNAFIKSQLANTNIAIVGKASWSALTSTNTALRTLISDRYQVANVNTLLAAKATWVGLTATNTALRILISDRIQVANVAAKYATKAYAASNAYVKLLLANTNAYIADVAASSGGGGGGFSAEALDYGFITGSIDVDTNRDYGTL